MDCNAPAIWNNLNEIFVFIFSLWCWSAECFVVDVVVSAPLWLMTEKWKWKPRNEIIINNQHSSYILYYHLLTALIYKEILFILLWLIISLTRFLSPFWRTERWSGVDWVAFGFLTQNLIYTSYKLFCMGISFLIILCKFYMERKWKVLFSRYISGPSLHLFGSQCCATLRITQYHVFTVLINPYCRNDLLFSRCNVF